MTQHGPFVGIIGFSESVHVAASILLEHQRKPFIDDLLFGIFFCGMFLSSDPEPQQIILPTVHVLGLSGHHVRESELLLGHCTLESIRKVVRINDGLGPDSSAVIQQVAHAVSIVYIESNRRRMSRLCERNH